MGGRMSSVRGGRMQTRWVAGLVRFLHMAALNPLTNDELYTQAPSIFAEEPAEDVSDRYAFVPTYTILDTFREAGYCPIMASESKVRNEENRGYQKHIIQFRSLDNLLRPNASEEYADIVLTNSHNRTSSFKVDLAVFFWPYSWHLDLLLCWRSLYHLHLFFVWVHYCGSVSHLLSIPLSG